MVKPLVVAACVAIAAGCTTVEDKKAEEQYREPVYRTGSNIPAGRRAAATGDKRELSPEERGMLDEMQTRSRTPIGATK